MTPSILTAAQEGLRLAEKHALLPNALKPLQDLQQHAHAHYADICRALIQLQAENAELKRQLEEAVKRAADCPNCVKLKSELDNATAARESAWVTVADEREKREQLLDKYYDLERQLIEVLP